ncbi:hypothetical protein KUTeg_011282 [Tegillarca granosa]|uniref:Tripartite motif-containing protein 2 n=1 Tax=Tegillarca granosa TaxID=220873 RepID=A0ABQ9F183_TEGGR|nr:hypothetical protein KUTeg_011282 [Tegillarca granosa]
MIDIKKRELLDISMKSKEKLSKYEQIVESVVYKHQVFSDKISQTIQDVKTRNTELKNLDKITNDIVQQLQQLEKQDREDNEKLKRQLLIELADLKQLIQKCGEEQARRSINVWNYVNIHQRSRQIEKKPPEFRTEIVEEELKTLFGSLVKSTSKDCQLLPLQEQDRDQTRSVLTPKINAVVRSTFPAKNNTRVTAAEHGQSWIWKRSSRNLSLVKLDGQLVSDIKTDFKVFDVLVTRNGELLVTDSCLLLRSKVKILTKDGNFTDIYSTTGYKTFGMTETDTGNVIVGLSSLVDGKLVEMTTEGTEMRTMKYDSIDNTKLFDYPYSLIVDDYTKTVVVVDQGGHKKATYDAKNENLTKPFHPRFIATDKLGQIFISDYENSVVHLLDKDGVFLEFLISDKNGCSEPFGLSIDSWGITDYLCIRDFKILLDRSEPQVIYTKDSVNFSVGVNLNKFK